MLEQIEPEIGKGWARDIQVFGGGDEFIARFVVDSTERPSMRMAEYVRFEGDRIAEVETYLGRTDASSSEDT